MKTKILIPKAVNRRPGYLYWINADGAVCEKPSPYLSKKATLVKKGVRTHGKR